ncbi:EF-P beta-lysylation protein EpmB [bacterium]|nr:EF-P beta-lysylation protein EpmB [bacterium]
MIASKNKWLMYNRATIPESHYKLMSMIALKTLPTRWQDEFQRIVTDVDVLIDRLNLPETLKTPARMANRLFPLRVPEPYLDRIAQADPDDPLLRQVLPLEAEFDEHEDFTTDPVGERALDQPKGMIQKYAGRVLLMLSSQCVINCRYCFRRHFPYSEHHINRAEWVERLAHITQDTTLTEVIYSGGDPLTVGDSQLAWFTHQISQIPHVKRLRIHTRLPVMIPSRITQDLINAITAPSLKTIVVIHANHAQEIDDSVADSLNTLKAANITLLNQSVLLKRINDSAHTLAALSERLFACGVLPYYLHQLDQVAGARHFALPSSQVQSIYKALQAMLPGYLVPVLVAEQAGELSKTRL